MSLLPPLSDADFVRGDRTAPLILVHYGDFECPFSGAAHLAIRAMERHFKRDLSVVFRPFPLPDLHPNALPAALAAVAAGQKFWAMHDMLFENQNALLPSDLKTYVRQIGLDEAQFERDFVAPPTAQTIENSIKNGRAAGAHGTPSIFINGVFHDNDEELWEEDELLFVLEKARRAA